ncbi:hypothetical protein ACH4OW_29240 [Streptomyces sp. NPDC017056]|uniref:hypothetical protein n=1 Tax=Streptomyces sp. NPDC017056 TaxID=3364973 RepID=UPI00379701F8
MNHALIPLAAAETRIALRSPLLWLLTLLTATGRTLATWQEMPNWSVATVDTATSALLVGAAAMLAANLATLRDRRADAVELTGPLPVRPQTRTLAVLLAYPPVAMAYAAIAMGVQLAGMLVGSRPIGHLDIRELLSGVLLVGLMAVLGTAVGRWAPNLFAAPVGILLFFWTLMQFPQSWLLPVVPYLKLAIEPVRPPAWHLVYVTALILVAGTAALLRHSRSLGLVLASVGSAAAVAVATVMTLHSPAAAAAALAGDLRKTQRAETGTFDPAVTDRSVLTTTSWGRNGAGQDSRRALAAQMAAAATGFPWGTRHGAGPAGCDASGQARTVVALWLIGQTEEPLPATSTRMSVRTDGGDLSDREVPTSDLGAVRYGQAELAYARRLMARPEARERVRANWSALTDPATTVDQALPLLRLDRTAASRTPEGTPCD